MVYERINAKSLSSVIAASPEKTEEYGHLIAAALKKLHSTEFDKDNWYSKTVTANKGEYFIDEYWPENTEKSTEG